MRVGVACLSFFTASLLWAGGADANPIPGTLAQVGPWRVGAYTRGQTTVFSHCAMERIQGDGFTLAVLYSGQDIWAAALEAPDWGLTPNETYTTNVTVSGASPYTFTGRAVTARIMTLRTAPELFPQLKSGTQFTAAANQHHYTMSLDGIEAATARVKECFSRYSAPGAVPAQPAAPAAGSRPANAAAPSGSALVATIQTLLARLGYDPGPPTGYVGLKTNIAIAAFQKSQGLPGDGLPTDAVRARLEQVVAERSGTPPAERGGGSRPPATASAAPPTQPSPPPAVGNTAPAARPGNNGQREAVGSGTGFYISRDTLVTNFHVVRDCAEMRIHKNGAEQGAARVLAVSQSDDLAVLQSATPSPSYLKLRTGSPIKPAESVLVFGYPLAGALSSTGNTTLGNVTALTGMKDDSRYIQISASVQPGNSGGPAIDEQGRLMGVVVAKLNALAIAMVTGDIPQNVNFAIKASVLTSFLEAHNVAYEGDSTSTATLPNTQRAERAETSSTQLECWK